MEPKNVNLELNRFFCGVATLNEVAAALDTTEVELARDIVGAMRDTDNDKDSLCDVWLENGAPSGDECQTCKSICPGYTRESLEKASRIYRFWLDTIESPLGDNAKRPALVFSAEEVRVLKNL